VEVDSWSVTIVDAQGTPVREFTGQEELPEAVEFDGQSDDGTRLPEGTYRAEISVLYVNGNAPTATTPEFVVDLTPPEATVQPEYRVFSPDGDGRKDAIVFEQEATPESEWQGVILDPAGDVVFESRFIGEADDTFEWDGTDAEGQPVPDGTYTYVLRTVDTAGNEGAAPPVQFELDTRPTPLAVAASPVYASPTDDGVADTVAIAPEVGIAQGIERYAINVVDETGTAVRTFSGTGAIPESVEWDGRRNTGEQVPDGTYSVRGRVLYIKGNLAEATGPDVVIDTAAPEVSVSVENPVFSPDGDGLRDEITIRQSTSTEDLWQARITDADDTVVHEFSWQGTADDLVWDGRDASGNVVADGVYTYTLAGTDRAGNVGRDRIERIRIDTRPTPVALKLNTQAFSPNGDGTLDTIRFTPELEVTSGIDSWTVTITPTGGATATKSWSGEDSQPGELTWDGRTDRGSRASEDTYVAALAVTYDKGNRETARTGRFELDVTEPRAQVRGIPTIISPNGDNRQDTVELTQSASREQGWRGVVVNARGEEVRTFSFGSQPDAELTWNGRDDRGRLVPNGTYRYTLGTTDRAGNSGGSSPVSIRVDVRETPVSLAADHGNFSPNDDGERDTVELRPDLRDQEGVASYEIEIQDARGRPVRTYSGRRVPSVVNWDGETDQRRRAPDGNYRATLEVAYENGNLSTAQSRELTLDTVAPEVSLSADYRLFSPDGDGRRDSVRIEQRTSREERWLGEILDSRGRVVRSFEWTGRPPALEWDGRDSNRNLVSDGMYSYQLGATDAAGNTNTAGVAGIRIDTRPTPAFISTNQRGLSPNGDLVADVIAFRLIAGLTDGLSSWRVSIEPERGSPVRTFRGTGAPPETLSWDGTRPNGAPVPEGEYTAGLTLEYEKGNHPTAETRSFVLDTSGPEVALSVAPKPFSPDNDGVDDELTISPTVADDSRIESWELVIRDPTGSLFNQFSGRGEPTDRIQWNGLSSTGELVQSAMDYALIMRVRDSLGNEGRIETDAPVDVLVVREDGQLKIKVASIVFAPNTANYLNVPDEQRERNIRTLDRLAEILERYNTYNIRIEGHAVMVYWNDPERGAEEQENVLLPLSQARADSVKEALVERGIDAERMSTVGHGALYPIVPFSDLENRWKNRRVEFILIR
jgi:flagellar hook assembly protein FlgD/outer membrane protein OmpA-like peptidoglycan-associated protein